MTLQLHGGGERRARVRVPPLLVCVRDAPARQCAPSAAQSHAACPLLAARRPACRGARRRRRDQAHSRGTATAAAHSTVAPPTHCDGRCVRQGTKLVRRRTKLGVVGGDLLLQQRVLCLRRCKRTLQLRNTGMRRVCVCLCGLSQLGQLRGHTAHRPLRIQAAPLELLCPRLGFPLQRLHTTPHID